MDELLAVLEKYGLELAFPESKENLMEIKKWSDELEKSVSLDTLNKISSLGIQIKVKDIQLTFERFSLPKNKNPIHPICVRDISVRCNVVENSNSKELNAVVWFANDNFPQKIEEDIKEDMVRYPENYGLDDKRYKLRELFTLGRVEEKRAKDMVTDYLVSIYIHHDYSVFTSEIKQALENGKNETIRFEKLLNSKINT